MEEISLPLQWKSRAHTTNRPTKGSWLDARSKSYGHSAARGENWSPPTQGAPQARRTPRRSVGGNSWAPMLYPEVSQVVRGEVQWRTGEGKVFLVGFDIDISESVVMNDI